MYWVCGVAVGDASPSDGADSPAAADRQGEGRRPSRPRSHRRAPPTAADLCPTTAATAAAASSNGTPTLYRRLLPL